MKIVVGSKNPTKIQAAKEAFLMVFPNKKWEVVGIDVESGVVSQPMSDDESIKGARNRAKAAIKKIKANYGVGLEGGLQKIDGMWFDCGWIVIIDKEGNEGIGSTIKMHTPKKFMKLIDKGIELGIVNDMIFKTKNSKHAEGHFGLMTNGAITRTKGYRDGVISALSRFIHPELFKK
ncbi:MAG: inosine/xanthosine triphosphatase [Patescibacteria group bacterium]|nr:inosine/xanthosine triphosphatase [Patescibacteria group bacterium]